MMSNLENQTEANSGGTVARSVLQPLRKPEWLKTPIARGHTLFKLKKDMREKRLFTVCEEAKCPNISECWQDNTATFMILGDTCTRGCRFCNVKTGDLGGYLDENEPDHVAKSVAQMELGYVVLTMVNRDDVVDGGAEHIFKVITRIRELSPNIKIEFLAGDFRGNESYLKRLLESKPVVFAHNIETVERLSRRVRDVRADYRTSLSVLKKAKEIADYPVLTKSAIMVGLGETREDVLAAMQDLREVSCDFLTIGQYMSPSPKHLAVREYVHPDLFREYGRIALDLGFKMVASAPLVRSSYRAEQFYRAAMGEAKSENIARI
jgi:lipoic acid synthetase